MDKEVNDSHSNDEKELDSEVRPNELLSSGATAPQNQDIGVDLATHHSKLKEIHALRQVLSRHNIVIGELDISGLSLENGEVKGEIKYSPPAIKKVDRSVNNRVSSTAFSRDDIKAMSQREVEQNFDKVIELMRG